MDDGRYSKDDIVFGFPAVVDGEIVTEESMDDPFKVDFRIFHDVLFDGIFGGCSCEIVGCTWHLWIETLELFGTL